MSITIATKPLTWGDRVSIDPYYKAHEDGDTEGVILSFDCDDNARVALIPSGKVAWFPEHDLRKAASSVVRRR